MPTKSISDSLRLAERRMLTEFTHGAIWQIWCLGASKSPPIVLNNSPNTRGTFSYGYGLDVRHDLHSLEVLLALEEDGYHNAATVSTADPCYGLKWLYFHDYCGFFQEVQPIVWHLYVSNLLEQPLLVDKVTEPTPVHIPLSHSTLRTWLTSDGTFTVEMRDGEGEGEPSLVTQQSSEDVLRTFMKQAAEKGTPDTELQDGINHGIIPLMRMYFVNDATKSLEQIITGYGK